MVSDDYIGLDQEDWNICTFRQDWYFLSIQSTLHTYQELLQNPLVTGFADALVGNRQAVTYHRFDDTTGDDCSLGFEYAQGLIVLNVSATGIEVREAETCPLVQQIAETLQVEFPK
ncbi:hypothetical protein RU01_06925 [Rhodococcus sp. MEB064]|nr:hypothetical protein RU01_06925 [Rhodococcus sp. MEB064]